MQSVDKIKAYCDKVSEQIRWKKAKSVITAEIEDHLCDQRDAYMESGQDEMTATEQAILQMGDAVSLGQELDKVHKPKPQRLMIVFTGLFMLLGFFLNSLLSQSMEYGRSFGVLSYIMAFGIFLGCYYLDFTVLRKFGKTLYGLTILCSILMVVCSVQYQGRLYVRLGGFSMALSMLSLIFPLAFAVFVYSMRNQGFRGIVMSGLAYLPFAMILYIVPSVMGVLLYTVTACSVLCLAISRGWFGVNPKKGLALVLFPAVGVTVYLVAFMLYHGVPHLQEFLHPSQEGIGYSFACIRGIVSESVFLGQGGIPDWIPNLSEFPMHTDYMLTYLVHRFGYIALFVLIVFLAIFSIVGVRKALGEKSVLGSMVALSIILTFVLQSVFYVIANLGYGLFGALSLPFLSYGTAPLFLNAALIGFMLSVFRTGEVFCDNAAAPKEQETMKPLT